MTMAPTCPPSVPFISGERALDVLELPALVTDQTQTSLSGCHMSCSYRVERLHPWHTTTLNASTTTPPPGCNTMTIGSTEVTGGRGGRGARRTSGVRAIGAASGHRARVASTVVVRGFHVSAHNLRPSAQAPLAAQLSEPAVLANHPIEGLASLEL